VLSTAEIHELYRLISEELKRNEELERDKLDYLAGKILLGLGQMLGG